MKVEVLNADIDSRYTKLAWDIVFDETNDGMIHELSQHVSIKENELIMDSDFEIESEDEDAE
jgi:hypothetical protein